MTKRRKLIWLNGLFVMAILASSITASKLFGLFGSAINAGVISFPISFLVTDIINEVWGKEEASNTVKIGFVANILFTLFIIISIKLPPFEHWALQEAYQSILSAVPRITAAGLISYAISQNIDVWIFDRIKQKHGKKHLWIRNNISTMTSQLVDSAVFNVLAFGGSMPVSDLVKMSIFYWIVKLIIAALDTPFAYLGVWWVNRSEE